jgi:hypothetical protein
VLYQISSQLLGDYAVVLDRFFLPFLFGFLLSIILMGLEFISFYLKKNCPASRLGAQAKPSQQTPAQSAGRETKQPAAAMEFFPDGTFVRLQSRVRRKYLHADEDGSRVRR